jgi:hypothetical protein
MQEIFSRKGNKTRVGNVSVTLPNNVSFLSIVGNPMSNGEEFRDDGFVYRKGKRLRKWFRNKEGWNHFWPPVLDQLARIEALYFKSYQRFTRQQSHVCDILKKIFKTKHKIAHYSCFVDNKTRYGEFKVEESADGLVYSCIVLDKKPDKMINKALGAELHKLYYRSSFICGRLRDLLNEAIIKAISKEKPEKETIFKLDINNRTYFYRYEIGHRFSKIAWPNDCVKTLVF